MRRQLLFLLLAVALLWLAGCGRQQPPESPVEVEVNDSPDTVEVANVQTVAKDRALSPEVQAVVDDAAKRLSEHEIQTAGLNFIAESYADSRLYDLVEELDDALIAARIKLQKVKMARPDRVEPLINQLNELINDLDRQYKLAIEHAENLQVVELESLSDEAEEPKEEAQK